MARIVAVCVAVSGLVIVPAHAQPNTSFPNEPAKPFFTVGRTQPLTLSEANRIIQAVESVGAHGYVLSFPFIGLTAHRRGDTELWRLTNRWRIPMSAMVIPQQYIRIMGGEAMANAAGLGQVLIGESAAKYRKAQVGDTLVLRDAKFQPHSFVVGAIVPDAFVDWGDITITSEAASVLGSFRRTSVLITDIPSYTKVARALKSKKFSEGTMWRYRKSWDLESPDGTLGISSVKKKLGEFAYRPAGGNGIEISASWRAENIGTKNVFSDIPLNNNCHKVVVPAIQGALTEIKRAGLASVIDVRNANRYGGCFAARYNRSAGVFGSVARHSWGMALDINTVTNAQGATPTMNCDVVRIFRKWGFAWGGNFRPADGMHFEYVGKPLHELGYPSRYCPNKVPVPPVSLPLFDDDLPSVTTTPSSTSPSTSTPDTTPATP